MYSGLKILNIIHFVKQPHLEKKIIVLYYVIFSLYNYLIFIS